MNPKTFPAFRVTLWVLVTLCFSSASEGATQKVIRLRNHAIITEITAKRAAPLSSEASASGLFLIQFTSALQPEWRKELLDKGVRLLRFVPDDAFVARLDRVRPSQIETLPFVSHLEVYGSEHKVHSGLNAKAKGKAQATQRISVLLAPDSPPQELAKLRGTLRKVEKESALRFGHILQGEATPEQLTTFANSSAVLWIEPAPTMKLFDEIAAKITGGDDGEIGTRTVTQQLGFDGTGITVAVADSGLQEGNTNTMHPDLAGRVDAFFFYGALADAADEHSHGTHVAGIIAGNAATGEVDDSGSLYGLGVAPGAHLVAQRIFDGEGAYEAPPSFENLTHDAVRAGADIGSNSWGDDTQGRYDLSAAEFDELVRDADAGTAGDQPYILEFSAGNAGPGVQTIGSPAVAKNVIASGAVENNRFDLYVYDSGQETMADFSSRGPCEDGRIKPDVVAPGTWIASLRSSLANEDFAWAPISERYIYQGGTSQSGPHVSGAAAVFAQFYRETVTNAMPSPALVKAALINSAVDADESGGTASVPNNDEGWGRVDLTELIDSPRGYDFVDQTIRLTNNQIYERHVIVRSSDEPLKITLTYTDVPGFPAAIPALVNDLNLEVIAPDGKIFRGNQFENGESISGALAFDTINNIEAVHLSEPIPGDYTVRIHARSVVEDARRDTASVDQDFALVTSADLPLPGEGVLFFEKKLYSAPAAMKLKLIDFNLAGQSSVNVLVKSSTEANGEVFVLNAEGSSGTFTTAVASVTGPAIADGRLQVSHNDVIETIYQDAAPAGTRHAFARADLFPPVLANVAVTNRFGRMFISWQTDEPSDSTVRFGTNSVLSQTATNSRLTTLHEIALENFVTGRTYQFLIISSDGAGNTATNNNGGALFSFVAVRAATLLLVDDYTDELFSVPPLSGYTDALNQVGLDYEIWNTETNGSPTFDDLKPFRAVIWRLPEFTDTFSPAERAGITNYLNGGGSLLVASMEVLSRLEEANAGAFRRDVFHVTSFGEDEGVPAIVGTANDPITSGIETDLDFSIYEDDFKDILGLPADVSDTIVIDDTAAPILFDSSPGEVVGLRYPRIGQDSSGRVIFLSFPLDAIPTTGADPNNRANILRNLLAFLVPGANGLGSIAMNSSIYTIPSLVTVEVADSDLAGSGQTTATFFSNSAPSGQTVILAETPRPGLFRGTISLVSNTNSFRAGELRVASGDSIRAEYSDASSGGLAQALATVDIFPASITNVSVAAEYEEAVVEWQTSKPTDALVQFGESTFLGRTAYRSTFDYNHSLTLVGLHPDRTYFFRVTSTDAAGNVTTDDNHGNFYTFTTQAAFATPFFDNLENSRTNWTVLDGEAGTTTWQLGTPNNGMETEAHSPTNAWGSNLRGNNIDIGDTTLASPAIALTGGNQATLHFWHSYDFTAQSDSDIYEYGAVYVSTNNGNAWIPLVEFEDSSFGWDEATVDLTPYIGHVVRVGFYYGFFSIDGGNHPGWLIDDVSVIVTNAVSQFLFKSLTFTNNQARLTFAAPPGVPYVIEGSTNLINWIPLQTNSGVSGDNAFTDVQSTNFTTRFYRLRK